MFQTVTIVLQHGFQRGFAATAQRVGQCALHIPANAPPDHTSVAFLLPVRCSTFDVECSMFRLSLNHSFPSTASKNCAPYIRTLCGPMPLICSSVSTSRGA